MATIIVGASQGLGEALCEVLVSRGHQVVAGSRNIERLEGMKHRLLGLKTFACDVRSEPSMKQLMEFASLSCGAVSTLVYVAGINFDDVVADWEDTSNFRLVIETNRIGAASALHAALPLLSASPKAQVIAITSLAGVIGCVPGGSAYAASKAGLDAFFCSCAPELKALGIKVLIVDPGSMLPSDDTRQQRQVVGSGTRYRDVRAKGKRGRPVLQVAEQICNAMENGRLALRVRFKNGGRLPTRLRETLREQGDDEERDA